MSYQDDFEEIENLAAGKRREQDFADQQNEYAGNDVGRAQRFLTADGNNLIAGKNKGKNSNGLSSFDLLMLDSAYANLYNNTMSQLGDAERATETALEKWIAIAAQTRTDLSDTLDRAYQLDNGLHIFRDDQGQVWDENDQLVDDNIADTIEWSGFEPTRAEFLHRRIADQETQNTLLQFRINQTDLGDIRNKMTDSNNPPSIEEVEAMQSRIEQIQSATEEQQPNLAQQELSNTTDTSIERQSAASISIPTLD